MNFIEALLLRAVSLVNGCGNETLNDVKTRLPKKTLKCTYDDIQFFFLSMNFLSKERVRECDLLNSFFKHEKWLKENILSFQ